MFVDGRSKGLTYANIHIVQLCRGIAVVSKLAQLAVLPPSVVLTAHANDGVQHLDVTAAIGVTEAFAILQKGERDGAVFRVSVSESCWCHRMRGLDGLKQQKDGGHRNGCSQRC